MRTLLHHHALLRQAMDATLAVDGDRRQRLLGVAHRLWQWLPMAEDEVTDAIGSPELREAWEQAGGRRARIDQAFAGLYRDGPATAGHAMHFEALQDTLKAYLQGHVRLVPAIQRELGPEQVAALDDRLIALRGPYERLWILPVAWGIEA